MQPEILILSEKSFSEGKKQIPYAIYMRNLKYGTGEPREQTWT